jgi:hypothetical protein
VGGKTQERWARFQRKGAATQVGDKEKLVWGDPVIDIAGYVLERSAGSSSAPNDPKKHWKQKK